jgi:hypothetical protein
MVAHFLYNFNFLAELKHRILERYVLGVHAYSCSIHCLRLGDLLYLAIPFDQCSLVNSVHLVSILEVTTTGETGIINPFVL